jgi:hypothetical protein
LDQFHVIAGTAQTPALLLIHDSHPYESWNIAGSFDLANPGLFCVVGSKSRIPPKEVWAKVGPFIQGDNPQPPF